MTESLDNFIQQLIDCIIDKKSKWRCWFYCHTSSEFYLILTNYSFVGNTGNTLPCQKTRRLSTLGCEPIKWKYETIKYQSSQSYNPHSTIRGLRGRIFRYNLLWPIWNYHKPSKKFFIRQTVFVILKRWFRCL